MDRMLLGFVAVLASLPVSAFVCGDQEVTVEFFTPRTVRIVKTLVGTVLDQPFETVIAKTLAVRVSRREGESSTWTTDELEVRFDGKSGLFSFWTPKGERLVDGFDRSGPFCEEGRL